MIVTKGIIHPGINTIEQNQSREQHWKIVHWHVPLYVVNNNLLHDQRHKRTMTYNHYGTDHHRRFKTSILLTTRKWGYSLIKNICECWCKLLHLTLCVTVIKWDKKNFQPILKHKNEFRRSPHARFCGVHNRSS